MITDSGSTSPLADGAAPEMHEPSSSRRMAADPGLVEVFPGATPCGTQAGFSLARGDGWLIGTATIAPDGAGIEAAARKAYADLFEASAGWHLARIWNYVPAINAIGGDGLENYRAFCRGRSVAFEDVFGAGFKRRLPAASAVGTELDELVVAFAASAIEPMHVENPQQVPAYDYPTTYGPRSPSFARATVVNDGALGTVFVSGTSAIVGHATVAPFDTRRQLDCTLANLRTIGAACGLGATLGAGRARRRHFRVYLRDSKDRAWIAPRLEAELLQSGDAVSYVRADICRRELNVEIEATLCGLSS